MAELLSRRFADIWLRPLKFAISELASLHGQCGSNHEWLAQFIVSKIRPFESLQIAGRAIYLGEAHPANEFLNWLDRNGYEDQRNKLATDTVELYRQVAGFLARVEARVREMGAEAALTIEDAREWRGWASVGDLGFFDDVPELAAQAHELFIRLERVEADCVVPTEQDERFTRIERDISKFTLISMAFPFPLAMRAAAKASLLLSQSDLDGAAQWIARAGSHLAMPQTWPHPIEKPRNLTALRLALDRFGITHRESDSPAQLFALLTGYLERQSLPYDSDLVRQLGETLNNQTCLAKTLKFYIYRDVFDGFGEALQAAEFPLLHNDPPGDVERQRELWVIADRLWERITGWPTLNCSAWGDASWKAVAKDVGCDYRDRSRFREQVVADALAYVARGKREGLIPRECFIPNAPPSPPGQPRKLRGRKPKTACPPQFENVSDFAEAWEKARDSGVKKGQFAADNRLTTQDVDNLLEQNRYQKRDSR